MKPHTLTHKQNLTVHQRQLLREREREREREFVH